MNHVYIFFLYKNTVRRKVYHYLPLQGSRYKLTYDGMYHFDIPKTRQYDTGKIEVIARSSVGEAIASTELKVVPRHDDYRSVLKNAPRRKYFDISMLTTFRLKRCA